MPNQPTNSEIRTALRLAIVFGVTLTVCTIGVQIWSGALWFAGAALSGLVLCLLLLAGIIKAFTTTQTPKRRWIAPIAISFAFLTGIPAAHALGTMLSDANARSRLKEYATVVNEIKEAKIPSSEILTDLKTPALPSGVKAIKAARKPDKTVVIVFLTESGFPLHHGGYVFDGSGTNADCATQFNTFSNRFTLRSLNNGWYHFSD